MLDKAKSVRVEISVVMDQPSLLLFVREIGVPVLRHLEQLAPLETTIQFASPQGTDSKGEKKNTKSKPKVRVSER